MNFYKAAGGLILGTRLKRLSDRFLQEVGQIYQALEIEFEPSWFPVFFLLREKGDLSMTDIASAMDVSHSAISQMISSLRKRELIQLIEDPQDARRKKISLTKLGEDLLQKVTPVWHSMQLAMPSLWGGESQQLEFLEGLDALEDRLSQKVFSTKTLALVPDLEFELAQLDSFKPNAAFEAFKANSEGRFLDLPEGVQIWVTLHKGQVVGALAILPQSKQALHLWQFFVQSDYRRKGLATSMIKEALRTLGKAELKVEDPQLPLIQLLIKAKVTFTVAPNNQQLMNKQKFHYGVDQLSIGLALEMAAGSRVGVLNKEACERIQQSCSWVDAVVSNEQVVYGVTTGFGPLCTTLVGKELTQELQHNLLKSHSVGLGNPIPRKVAKLMLILKAQALSQGYSGIRLRTLERILWHIDHDIIPFVPEKGSVGASGDLAPLSHLFLPLIGLGKVFHQGSYQPSGAVLQAYGLSPLQLEAKEGLALINGTQFMAAYGIVVAERLQRCLDQADITAAMMLEALTGSAKPFHPDLHRLRPHPGCNYVAQRLRQLLHGSAIMKSHENCERVQDPYSLRCIPQVHGASRQAWLHLKESIHTEINSVTDNPIILDETNIISGGNFHGQPIALPLDYAAMAAAEIGNIADRRIYLSIEGKMPGVPKLLMDEVGLNSGFMIPQYTTAALVSENKSLCFPASVDSVPTSLGQEDHVSMGSISGRKAYQVVHNLEQILGIELLYAAQGLDFHRPLSSSVLLDACYQSVRSKIKHRTSDTLFEEELAIVIEMVREGQLQQLTDELAQKHQISFKNSTHELYGLY